MTVEETKVMGEYHIRVTKVDGKQLCVDKKHMPSRRNVVILRGTNKLKIIRLVSLYCVKLTTL